ncbi:MAG: hypothetical protein NTU98_14405 [Bacteroidetes bacterium]|nr:hypothetical protein [Bacteroidota bacterium]
MKEISRLIKKIWKDPVLSNLIANGLIALVAWIFYSITTATSPLSNDPDTAGRIHRHVSRNPHFLHTDTGRIVIYSVHAILLVGFVIFFRGAVKGYLRKNYRHQAALKRIRNK